MKKIEMSEDAYAIVGDLKNVRRAYDALRDICQPDNTDYISKKDYQEVMCILSKWSDEIFERIGIVSNTGEGDELIAKLECLKVGHYICGDCWYSCPKSYEGCCDESQEGCTCGADKHNAEVDSLIAWVVKQKISNAGERNDP